MTQRVLRGFAAVGTSCPPLQVEYLRPGAVQPDPTNPRKHSKKQIRQLATSIDTFGFVSPMLVDQHNNIIGGHGRHAAALLLGMTEVPVIRLEHLTPPKIRALMIADNRLTENSEWDDELLAKTLKDLTVLDLEFSLEVTGFEMAEIDFRIEALDEKPEPEEAEGDLTPARAAITARNDLWYLGEHKLLCADALENASYDRLLGAERAAMVFTDSPYNVPIAGHVSGLGAVQHREFEMAAGEMSEDAFAGFLAKVCHLLAAYSVPGSLHYHFMDWRHLGELIAAGKAAYSEMKNLCVWAKDNAGMGAFYRSQHELIAVFKSGKGRHRNNIQLGRFGRHRSNVWRYAGMTSIARATDEGELLAAHPTVKPVRLVADAILDASLRGDLVLDPFLGSGTTLIAADRVGRRCRAIELDPRYVDVAIRRWQRDSGGTAIHGETGRSFDDIAAEVSND